MPDEEVDARAPPVPRWVKVFVVVGIIAALVVVIVLVFGGADHGPGRHATPVAPEGGASSDAGFTTFISPLPDEPAPVAGTARR